MGITEAVTYASQRTSAGVRAATTWIWRRDCQAYLVLRRSGFRELGERLMNLTLGAEQEIRATDEWHRGSCADAGVEARRAERMDRFAF